MNNWETLLAQITLNTLWQSAVIGMAGLAVLRWQRRHAAAVRAMTALCLMAVLAVLPAANRVWSYVPESPTVPQTAAVPQAVETSAAAVVGTAPQPATEPVVKPAKDWKRYSAGAILTLTSIWMAGTLIMLGRLAYGLIFLRGFRFGLKPVSDPKIEAALCQAATLLPRRRLPAVFTSPAATSPLTVGIVKPVMILPENLLGALSENEVSSIVLHEFSHICRRDHLTGIFIRLLEAAYWWNPAVYLLGNAYSEAAEELSDNYALLQLKPEDYSECLLQLAEKPA